MSKTSEKENKMILPKTKVFDHRVQDHYFFDAHGLEVDRFGMSSLNSSDYIIGDYDFKEGRHRRYWVHDGIRDNDPIDD